MIPFGNQNMTIRFLKSKEGTRVQLYLFSINRFQWNGYHYLGSGW